MDRNEERYYLSPDGTSWYDPLDPPPDAETVTYDRLLYTELPLQVQNDIARSFYGAYDEEMLVQILGSK